MPVSGATVFVATSALDAVKAAIFAARRKAESVTMDDFERATERVIGGLPKTNSLMTLGFRNPEPPSAHDTLALRKLNSIELKSRSFGSFSSRRCEL